MAQPASTSVRTVGIEFELDDAGKEYVMYKFGVYIDRARVHTIGGRYSELRGEQQPPTGGHSH
jgi:hypothetical protein